MISFSPIQCFPFSEGFFRKIAIALYVLFLSCPLPSLSIERGYCYLEAKKSNSITTMELITAYYGEKIEIAFAGQVQIHSSLGSKVQDFL